MDADGFDARTIITIACAGCSKVESTFIRAGMEVPMDEIQDAFQMGTLEVGYIGPPMTTERVRKNQVQRGHKVFVHQRCVRQAMERLTDGLASTVETGLDNPGLPVREGA